MAIWKYGSALVLAMIGCGFGVGCRQVDNVFSRETDSVEDAVETDESSFEASEPPRNVILLIGDGMGQNQIAATGMYKNGAAGTLYFESFPVHGLIKNDSADSEITDSAASSTAMGCGRKVNNGVVAMAVPGGGEKLFCLVDYFKQKQKSTGLVTTTFMTDATPAAFAAHATNRADWDTIAWHYLNTGRPDILFGGGGYGLSDETAQAAGYAVIHNLEELDSLLTETEIPLAGFFGEGYYPYEAVGVIDRPHLYESAVAAIDLLSSDPDGFFVMIEGGMIDRAGHLNRLDFVVGEVIAFEQTVHDAVRAVDLSETLAIVTADHATGDLQIVQNNGRGVWPDVVFGTTGHNVGAVDLFATGRGADVFQQRLEEHGGVIDNTEIFSLLAGETP